MIDKAKEELNEEQHLKTEADFLNEWASLKEQIFTMAAHVGSYEQRISKLEYLISMVIDHIPEVREKFEKLIKEQASGKDKFEMSDENRSN